MVDGRTNNTLRVVVTDHGFPDLEAERNIVASIGAELEVAQCKTAEEVIASATEADGLLVQWAPITREVISELRHCKVIVRYGVGVDNIDVAAAKSRGISVCNVPDYCMNEVADHTMALALALVRQLPSVDQ
jgi:D-3-phosphoglycerate dehydrogenase / 2-oxoglutarate reductase